MKPSEAELRYFMDRVAIEDVLNRYFRGIDRRDFAMVRSCFAEDIKAVHHKSPLIEGLDTLMAELEKRSRANKMRIMTHFMGNLNVDMVEPDVALVETNAISFHVHDRETEQEVDMRSLRYLDKLRRIGGKWLISERRHTLDWNCKQTAAYAAAFAERVNGLQLF